MQLNPSMVTFEAAQVNRPPMRYDLLAKSLVLTITEVNNFNNKLKRERNQRPQQS